MSTTVIASAHGASLFLFPLAGGAVDKDALEAVLRRHGLAPLADPGRSPEFVAARGLSLADAHALAEDLRGIGLQVRVVPRDDIRLSSRVGQALSAWFISGVFTLPGLVMLASGEIGAVGLVPVAVAALAALNAAVVGARGGNRLPVIADRSSIEEAPVLTAIEDLRGSLPDTLADDLLERARVLVRRARTNPDGQAAAELRTLSAELEGLRDEADVAEVRDLRGQLARARAALTETERLR